MPFVIGRRIISVRVTPSLHSHTDNSTLKKSENMHPPQSCLAIFLSLMFFAGAIACGPASSDNAPNLGSRANVSGPAVKGAGQGGKTGSTPGFLENETSSASGKGTVPGSDSVGQEGKLSKLADTANVESDGRDKLPIPGIPESIAKGLDSPDARERIQALDHWEKKGTKAPLDPVFEAFEDENEAVRAKAAAIIEQQWATEREREKG